MIGLGTIINSAAIVLGGIAGLLFGRFLKERLQESLKRNPGAGPVLEELEKSIVAQLADEVTIGIHGRRIRLVISKSV